jgi:hypothetical protein
MMCSLLHSPTPSHRPVMPLYHCRRSAHPCRLCQVHLFRVVICHLPHRYAHLDFTIATLRNLRILYNLHMLRRLRTHLDQVSTFGCGRPISLPRGSASWRYHHHCSIHCHHPIPHHQCQCRSQKQGDSRHHQTRCHYSSAAPSLLLHDRLGSQVLGHMSFP